MAMKLGKLFDVQTYYATLSDDQEGEQIAILGVVPALKRVVVISKTRVEKAQSGGSQFGVLPKELELEFLKRVRPDLIDASVPAPVTPGHREVDPAPAEEGDIQTAPARNPGVPAKLRGR